MASCLQCFNRSRFSSTSRIKRLLAYLLSSICNGNEIFV